MKSADLPIPDPQPNFRVRRMRDRLIVGALLAFFALGIVGLARTTGWQDLKDQFQNIGLLQCALLLFFSLLNYGFRGLRWHLFAKSIGAPTSLGRNLLHFAGGFAMIVTPGRLGELVRVRWLARDAGWPLERAAPLAIMDRASDLASVALLLGLSVTLASVAIHGALAVAIMALVAAAAITHPEFLAWLLTLAYRASGRFPRAFARARRSARSLAAFSGPKVLLPALVLGLIGWAAEGLAFQYLLHWLGTETSFATALAIFLFSALAGGMTGSPGGVGGAEAAMIALLALDGVPLHVAIAATAIIRVTTLWFAVGLGAVFFPIAEKLSFKEGA